MFVLATREDTQSPVAVKWKHADRRGSHAACLLLRVKLIYPFFFYILTTSGSICSAVRSRARERSVVGMEQAGAGPKRSILQCRKIHMFRFILKVDAGQDPTSTVWVHSRIRYSGATVGILKDYRCYTSVSTHTYGNQCSRPGAIGINLCTAIFSLQHSPIKAQLRISWSLLFRCLY